MYCLGLSEILFPKTLSAIITTFLRKYFEEINLIIFILKINIFNHSQSFNRGCSKKIFSRTLKALTVVFECCSTVLRAIIKD